MTRKEAIGNLNMIRVAFIDTVTVEQGRLIDDTFIMAIKALEQEKSETVTEFADRCRECGAKYGKLLKQEPCEDAISREKTCDYIAEFINHEYSTQSECEMVEAMIDGIQHLPHVNPQPKTGHWIEEIDDYGKVICWHCDKCYEDSGFTTDCKWKYCPSCGAKMVEPQESEGTDADNQT